MSESPMEDQILHGKDDKLVQNPSPQNDQSQQEWQIMAEAWVTAFPEVREVSVTEVESWIESNRVSLPTGLRDAPNSELVERLLSIQTTLRQLSIQSQVLSTSF